MRREADVTRSNTEKVYYSNGVVGKTETLAALQWPYICGGFFPHKGQQHAESILSSTAFKLLTELR